jgi:aspartate racemase
MLGVLGGMGPMATVDFLAKFVARTPAANDQGHIPFLVSSNPHIPNRTNAILQNGPSPFAEMAKGIALLERAGATALAIPCNTAHHWYEDLQATTRVPIIHIVDAVVNALRARSLPAGRIGLLATRGTIHARVYERRLERQGLETIVPDEYDQQRLMAAIDAVKAGETRDGSRTVSSVAAELRRRGAGAVIVACTELPLLVRQNAERDMVDATESLALACVRALREKAPEPSNAAV